MPPRQDRRTVPDEPPPTRLLTEPEIATLFARLRERNPAPATELRHSSPFTLLIAVILSAQATDVGVNRATERLFALAVTPERMLALGEDRVRELIAAINFHRGKARNVIATSRIILEEHGGLVPHSREALERLPGVGRKTAMVVLNSAFGEPLIAVDTHVFRVANRTGLAPGRNPLEVERALAERVPPEFRRYAHHWLILHGRYVCVARRPKCPECPVADLCQYPAKTPPAPAPADAPRPRRRPA